MRRALAAACALLVVAGAACSSGSVGPGPAAGSSTPLGVDSGLVSAATPEAAAAGAAILSAGGNAADAAVAVALALGVSEPAGSGLGGQTFVLLHPPGGEGVAVVGSSRAPRGTPGDADPAALAGRRAATVPSQIRVLELLWRRFGSGRATWPALLAPAIRLAEEGVRLGPFRHRVLARSASALRDDPATARLFLAAGGALPPADAPFRQPALARTLRRLAEAGPGDFYRGAIAREIAADMAAHGGWLDARDLAELPEPRVVPALRGAYRGLDVLTMPPPGGGWVVLRALGLLEHAEPAALSDPARGLVWMAEALRTAHAERLAAPIPDLLDPDEALRRRLDPEALRRAAEALAEGDGETTHFSVVDADGLAVAVTQSINSFYGAKVAAGDLGFLYNDYMHEFTAAEEGGPFALRPGAEPYSSMSPTIVAEDGAPRLVLGSPGSRRIVSAVVQVLSRWVDGEQDVAAAVAAPRLHPVPEEDALRVETRPASRAAVRALERRGFELAVPVSSLARDGLDPYFGGVHALARREARWRGAADPRRDGAVRAPTASRSR